MIKSQASWPVDCTRVTQAAGYERCKLKAGGSTIPTLLTPEADIETNYRRVLNARYRKMYGKVWVQIPACNVNRKCTGTSRYVKITRFIYELSVTDNIGLTLSLSVNIFADLFSPKMTPYPLYTKALKPARCSYCVFCIVIIYPFFLLCR